MREIVDDAGVAAVMPLQALQKLGSFRKVPLDAYYGAALTAGKDADCGPCLQLGVKMAEAEGVKPQTIRAILERDYGKCSKERAARRRVGARNARSRWQRRRSAR